MLQRGAQALTAQSNYLPMATEWALVGGENDNPDIYVFDFVGNRSIRLTSDPATERGPVWSPDGRKILFFSDRPPRGFFLKSADGAGEGELIMKLDSGSVGSGAPRDWSNDGRFVLYSVQAAKTKRDLLVFPENTASSATPMRRCLGPREMWR